MQQHRQVDGELEQHLLAAGSCLAIFLAATLPAWLAVHIFDLYTCCAKPANTAINIPCLGCSHAVRVVVVLPPLLLYHCTAGQVLEAVAESFHGTMSKQTKTESTTWATA